MSTWQWILGGEISRNGSRVHLFVVEMNETGGRYLAAPRPGVLRRVVLDAQTFAVVRTVQLPRTGLDLYGWSVTSDAACARRCPAWGFWKRSASFRRTSRPGSSSGWASPARS